MFGNRKTASTLTSPRKSPNTASEAIQLGLVGLLTRPVIKAVFPSEKAVTKSDQSQPQSNDNNNNLAVDNPISEGTPSPASTAITTPTHSSPTIPVLLPAHSAVPALGGSIEKTLPPVQQAQQPPTEPTPRSIEQSSPAPKAITTEQAYLPLLYTREGTHPIKMAVVANNQPEQNQHFGNQNDLEDHDYALSQKAQNLDLNDRPSSRATHRTNHTTQSHLNNSAGPAVVPGKFVEDYNDNGNQAGRGGEDEIGLGSALSTDPTQLKREVDQDGETNERPGMTQRASRSYVKPIPIVTTYEPELPDAASVKQRNAKAPSVKRASSKAGSVRSNKAASVNGDHARPHSVTGDHARSPSVNGEHYVRPPSVASVRRLPQHDERENGFQPGEIAPSHRQHELQGGNNNSNRVSLHDSGPVSRDRSTTFEEPDLHQRATSPNRPHSSFGYRPQPNLMSISEGDRPDSRADNQRDLRAGMLSRNGTTLSRAGTLGRNGTLSRGANGGTIGSRKGAFGRGAGTSVGTQPEEVLGRDDIHMRAELSERILDEATLRRLSTMERKDAKRLTKVIKAEAKSEAKSVAGSIKELERLTRLQREAASAERKSQLRLSKWTRKEHKARLRFLKEKERYEKIEGELRNSENDYEERRDHAAGLTSQVAEKTQEVDDLRAMKAADDREREVKLLALKNPAHS
ncbi:uncharacterized protein L199_008224 [Kwoniella botswanensis]|uniref:uncharacterized protein n=1 Tax=Kwoniella botswanensis TaxID=1268659 RepID=UPI00315DF213